MSLRVGTRASDLALVQAEQVTKRLAALGVECELVPLTTEGDRHAERAFDAFEERGVFVRELERALESGRIDLAVHSLKDLPADGPDGLVLAARPAREDPADVLLVREGAWQDDAAGLPLAPGARVGTSSSRRSAQLADARPDVETVPLRGNVPTRLARLVEGRCEAAVLAAAGLARLAADPRRGASLRALLGTVRRHVLDPARFVPAPGQGAIAVQARRADDALVARLAALDDPRCRVETEIERRLLAAAEAGCSVPFGALCRAADEDGAARFSVDVFLDRGGRRVRARVTGASADAVCRAALARLDIDEPPS